MKVEKCKEGVVKVCKEKGLHASDGRIGFVVIKNGYS